jgi:hypothetical protein
MAGARPPPNLAAEPDFVLAGKIFDHEQARGQDRCGGKAGSLGLAPAIARPRKLSNRIRDPSLLARRPLARRAAHAARVDSRK